MYTKNIKYVCHKIQLPDKEEPGYFLYHKVIEDSKIKWKWKKDRNKSWLELLK